MLTCPNKCSSQSRVLFSLQQHTTQVLTVLVSLQNWHRKYSLVVLSLPWRTHTLHPSSSSTHRDRLFTHLDALHDPSIGWRGRGGGGGRRSGGGGSRINLGAKLLPETFVFFVLVFKFKEQVIAPPFSFKVVLVSISFCSGVNPIKLFWDKLHKN